MNKLVKRKEENEKNRSLIVKSITYTLFLLFAALAIIMISSLLVSRPFGFTVREFGRTTQIDNTFILGVVLSSINVLLVLYLIYIYVKDYLQLKTDFTLGLLAFLFSFLLYSLSTLPLHGFGIDEGMESFASFLPLMFSALGLLIFVKISRE